MFLRSRSNASLVGVLHLPAARPRTSTTSCRLCTRSGNMESKQQTPSKSSEDIMSNSFGEGYATRSNEEGFGGIYPVTQLLNKDGEENDENSAAAAGEYDKSQGSEVKEKEKGRNQNEHGACN